MARGPSALTAAAGSSSGGAAAFRTSTNFARLVEGINRSALGRFLDGGGELITDVHRKMAVDASEAVADVLRQRVSRTGREQKGTDSLFESILDPRYQTANRDGFVLGGKAFEQSPARLYFRNLERGSDVFLGREIGGFFVGASGGISAPGKDRTDLRLIQLGRVYSSRPGARSTQDNPIPIGSLYDQKTGKLRVVKANANPDSRFGNGRTNGEGRQVASNFGYRIIIKNPIPAYAYFQRGGLDWLESGQAEALYAHLLKGTGARVGGRLV